ncbi:cupin domain-containing protein [Actinoplanes sp. N902-109]|uniref:cupin domain-containing protein n=1 Tax=Actinoplanes sp. (strain N902-109) TaxID=649831 RepID=UPI000329396C|nr:cupin domain-containing protein [Actinoplanes sp. N902-109]AGL16871.1 cupin 2 [Actinoplanes sp. N902-109]
MHLHRIGTRAAAVAAAAATTVGLAGTAAQATPPGPGVTGTIVWQKTVGPNDLILRDITIPPHQATGWHYHDGTLYGRVKQGTLSHFASTCRPDGTYHAGQFLTEPAGPGNVHIGRNLGDTPVVLEVLYVLPTGSPLAEDAPNPGCDFQ